jgi:hypothetical protein
VTSHFGLLLLFAAFTAVVFAVIAKDTVRDQLRTGARLFAGFVGAAIALGWLFYFIPL